MRSSRSKDILNKKNLDSLYIDNNGKKVLFIEDALKKCPVRLFEK
jgi:hypothetical protein